MLSCALLCVLRYAVLLQCNHRRRFTAPACELLGGWKQSYFCAFPSCL